MLAEMVLDSINVTLDSSFPYVETKLINHIGDLGGKFADSIVETVVAPKFNEGLLDQTNVEKLHETIVDGFNGTKQSFYNSRAPQKKSILVFGNSFFERIPSWGLSPFFLGVFERLHFIWTPSFDEAILDEVKPDVVISQTCERFMNRLPER